MREGLDSKMFLSALEMNNEQKKNKGYEVRLLISYIEREDEGLESREKT